MLETLIEEAQQQQGNAAIAKKAISLLDLTCLKDECTHHDIEKLCQDALTNQVAAVCIPLDFVAQSKSLITNPNIKIATVANFPSGHESSDHVVTEINQAITLGADEIDVVLPYQDYLSGKQPQCIEFIKQCKQASHGKTLKVILETGAFINDTDLIYQASVDMLTAGADFIKTSTGKIAQGATLHAAALMLQAIADTSKNVGFKASGGIKTLAHAASYLYLADKILGDDWVTPATFRFGASSLLQELINNK